MPRSTVRLSREPSGREREATVERFAAGITDPRAPDQKTVQAPGPFTNMYSIPVVGWILGFILTTSTAVPFWVCWTVCGIGRTYFYWLPPVYQEIPFWNCVGLFTAAGIVLRVFTPKFANVITTTTESPCKGK